MESVQEILKSYQDRLVNLTRNKSIFLNKLTTRQGIDLFDVLGMNTAKVFDFLEKRSDKKVDIVVTSADNLDSKEFYKRLKSIDSEIKKIQKETGRFELFIGYPFVEGRFENGKPLRAPIMLFPITIEKTTRAIYIRNDLTQNVIYNPSLLSALGVYNRMDLSSFEEEIFDFTSINEHVDYFLKFMQEHACKISLPNLRFIKNIEQFIEKTTKEVEQNYNLEQIVLKSNMVLGRFGAADNSLYAEYSQILSKNEVVNRPINQLLFGVKERFNNSTADEETVDIDKNIKTHLSESKIFRVNSLDYSQEQIVFESSQGKNIVMHGPPGTGKSQTISNVIAHNLMLGKKVLVVSEKRAALDVLYNRLAHFQEKIALVHDYRVDKELFYKNLAPRIESESLNSNQASVVTSKVNVEEKLLNLPVDTKADYENIIRLVDKNLDSLTNVYNVVNKQRPNGLTLFEMYQHSVNIDRESENFLLFMELGENKLYKKLLDLNHKQLLQALSRFKSKTLIRSIEQRKRLEQAYPILTLLDTSIGLGQMYSVETKMNELKVKFNKSKGYEKRKNLYLYKRQVAILADKENIEYSSKKVGVATKFKVLLGNTNVKLKNKNKKPNFDKLYLKTLDTNQDLQFFEKYDRYAESKAFLSSLNEEERLIYELIFETCNRGRAQITALIKNLPNFVLNSHINKIENSKKVTLLKIKEYHTLTEEISNTISVKNKQTTDYINEYWTNKFRESLKSADKELKRVVRAKRKKSIREFIGKYQDVSFSAYPVWLLSPESVSTVLPLVENMFDLVIYDEASQMFIERSIPSLYRGKNCLIGGDTKQLKPSSAFQTRASFDEDIDLAALVEESLLDLSVNCFDEVYLRYHYRAQFEELINFSNYAFYNGGLMVCPNTTSSPKERPISYIKVNKGLWKNQCNKPEAIKVVELVKKLLATRKNNETIGVVTFNAKQQELISDLLEKECVKDKDFGRLYNREINRVDDEEDFSLFVKNIENVQGDERDIIIFSVGYAKNEQGKVVNQFGSLSQQNGENRLNVAVSRAKRKIYMVASIEPEDLKVNDTLSVGAQLFKAYLKYSKLVSDNQTSELEQFLKQFVPTTKNKKDIIGKDITFEERVAKKMNKILYSLNSNYEFHTHVGVSRYKIGLALYDNISKSYVLGIECDGSDYYDIKSVRERDLYRSNYLTMRGWRLSRIWSTDWWRDEEAEALRILKTIQEIPRA